MVHNAVHHAFFNTLSLAIDVHPDIWAEIVAYCTQYTKWHGIKVEDSLGEGKVHVHWVQFREFAKFDENPSARVSLYGPRRAADNKNHITKCCPLMAGHIANYGSKHALQSLPLTSTQWIEYLNKESPCKINNLPGDPTLMQPYLSDHTEQVGDPAMVSDSKKYQECIDAQEPWASDPPTAQSCRRFYRFQMFKDKKKRVCIDENTIKKKGQALAKYINCSIYSDDEDDPSKRHIWPPGYCDCGVPYKSCLECNPE